MRDCFCLGTENAASIACVGQQQSMRRPQALGAWLIEELLGDPFYLCRDDVRVEKAHRLLAAYRRPQRAPHCVKWAARTYAPYERTHHVSSKLTLLQKPLGGTTDQQFFRSRYAARL